VWGVVVEGGVYEVVDFWSCLAQGVFADHGYHDFFVVCGEGVLCVCQEFFVEFFSGAEAYLFYFYVFAGDFAAEADHLLCQVVYLYCVSHVKDVDFA